MAFEGAAHTFGDDVNTDYITPSDYFGQSYEEIATHLFEPIDPGFFERFEPGDVVVAGENFGSGSSRETAPKTLKVAGVSAVVAESFARLFYRNGIAIGLPVVTCPGVTAIVSGGDEVSLDLERRTFTNETTDETRDTEPMPAEIRSIFDAGGLLAHYEQHPDGLVLD
ncbi:3-isopropylmalate dehydratase [Salinigranum marinum]|uniref:LeuD/DmdB family oxidoreductase small subunit n=1 Tax=Salinigranum marinum TaxID=1515595 RepID=UPI002989F335|nr:3-isopropylmalate dehydratase [Salinigranum marinum]